MLDIRLNLRLFGEGGDGGDGGAAIGTGENAGDSGEEVSALIPERARKRYRNAVEKHRPAADSVQAPNARKTEERKTYADIIKSDEYRDEHKAYMDKTIGDRLKKYKGIEDANKAYKEILDVVATKYGIDTDAEDFIQVLKAKAEADDSYYEQYAEDHDLTPEEARRMVTMERKVKTIEAEKTEAAKQEQARAQILQLQQNAEKTRAQFPDFDLDECMQDDRFRRICFSTNGDTTAAYMAVNYGRIIPQQIQMAAATAKRQTANAIAAGQSRPVENGAAGQATSVVTQDFSKMDLKSLREYAAQQRLARK